MFFGTVGEVPHVLKIWRVAAVAHPDAILLESIRRISTGLLHGQICIGCGDPRDCYKILSDRSTSFSSTRAEPHRFCMMKSSTSMSASHARAAVNIDRTEEPRLDGWLRPHRLLGNLKTDASRLGCDHEPPNSPAGSSGYGHDCVHLIQLSANDLSCEAFLLPQPKRRVASQEVFGQPTRRVKATAGDGIYLTGSTGWWLLADPLSG